MQYKERREGEMKKEEVEELRKVKKGGSEKVRN